MLIQALQNERHALEERILHMESRSQDPDEALKSELFSANDKVRTLGFEIQKLARKESTLTSKVDEISKALNERELELATSKEQLQKLRNKLNALISVHARNDSKSAEIKNSNSEGGVDRRNSGVSQSAVTMKVFNPQQA